MNFKLGASNFELLSKYIEKKAKGANLKLDFTTPGQVRIQLSNSLNEDVQITLFEESDTGTSFPKIAVTRRLGDEIK